MSSKVKEPDIDGHPKDSTGHGAFDEKKVLTEKRFIIPSRESIRMMAEAEGVTNLTDDGALILSEDLSYRLREIVQNSMEYMKHAKRRRLTTEDINDALRTSDMQPILGHGSPEPVSFKQVKDADIHFMEDLDLNVANIAFNSYKPKESRELGIKSFWYAIEGMSKISPVLNAAGETWKTPSFAQSKPVIVKKEKKELSENMLRYYDYMVKAILGADEEAMKFALSDLKTNSKIVPLLPYFVNFVSNGVKTVSHDISQLTKLLHTVKALTNNCNLYLEPEPYLGLLVQSVMYCGLEPLAASINPLNDHWVLRDYAARLLGHIVKKWSVHNSALLQNTLKSLKEVICDLSRPFCSHYGAVMALLALGTKAIEDVLLPQLQVYMPHLNNFMEDTSLTNALLRTDANKVYGAILLAAEYVMKNLLQQMDSQTPSANDWSQSLLLPDPSFQKILADSGTNLPFPQMTHNIKSEMLKPRTAKDIYSELYDYFGDMLSSKLPLLELQPIVYRTKKAEKLVKLYETNLSGEHLWQTMQERFVAEIRKEHEEQERLEEERRRERERQEQEQRERERLEREQQAAAAARAENLEKQQKRYRRQQQQHEKFWQQVHTDDEAEDSDNAVDNMDSSENTNSEEEESEDEEMEDDDEDDEEEEEEEEESDDDTDSGKETLAVARTVTNPEAGIKLVITKVSQKMHLLKNEKDSKSKSESSPRIERHKESRLSKKKKPSQRRNSNKYNSRMYCKEEESSSNGRKLTIRLRRSENPKTNNR